MELNNYLNVLKDKIRNLPQSYSKEIIKDYENHFKEGLLAGKTEKDIIDELGDVDSIARNIISEYYIEHSQQINNEKNTSKVLPLIINVILGILNFLVIIPFVLCVVVFVILLYIIDFILLLMPVFFIVNLVAPSLPIHFGPEIMWLKFLLVLVYMVIGYYFYKVLKKFSPKFFNWVFRYIVRSFKFQVFNLK